MKHTKEELERAFDSSQSALKVSIALAKADLVTKDSLALLIMASEAWYKMADQPGFKDGVVVAALEAQDNNGPSAEVAKVINLFGNKTSGGEAS